MKDYKQLKDIQLRRKNQLEHEQDNTRTIQTKYEFQVRDLYTPHQTAASLLREKIRVRERICLAARKIFDDGKVNIATQYALFAFNFELCSLKNTFVISTITSI